jgi:hypothetical protein
MEEQKKQVLRIGTSIIILLLFLTIVEYFIGQYVEIWWGAVVLLGISILKAFYIVRDYMHVGRLFAREEDIHTGSGASRTVSAGRALPSEEEAVS